MSKKNKGPKVYKDRFISEEKPDNVYVTAALYFLVFLMSFILIFVSFVSMCAIKGESMENSLMNTENVLLLRGNNGVERGKVVVVTVHDDEAKEGEKEKPIIKRVVATGGDKIVFLSNGETMTLWRKNAGEKNFKEVDELSGKAGYKIKEPMKTGLSNMYDFSEHVATKDSEIESKALTVDNGFLLLFGDNRNISQDSRYYGQIPESSVEGVMFHRLSKGSLLERLLMLIYPNRQAHI